jgi:hypothetical protein
MKRTYKLIASRGTEIVFDDRLSEIDLSEAKAPQGDRRRAGSNAEDAEKDAEWKMMGSGICHTGI